MAAGPASLPLDMFNVMITVRSAEPPVEPADQDVYNTMRWCPLEMGVKNVTPLVLL